MTIAENFFDIWNIMVNEVVGGVFLFGIIVLIFVIFFTMVRNMSFQITLMFVALWLLVMFGATLDRAWYVLPVLGIGWLFYSGISKAIKRA